MWPDCCHMPLTAQQKGNFRKEGSITPFFQRRYSGWDAVQIAPLFEVYAEREINCPGHSHDDPKRAAHMPH